MKFLIGYAHTYESKNSDSVSSKNSGLTSKKDSCKGGNVYLNLHNLIRIELINEPREVKSFYRDRLGLAVFEADTFGNDEADIEVTFVYNIKVKSNVEFIDDTAAYDDESFYKIAKGGGKICIPLESFDLPCRVICETSVEPAILFEVLEQLYMSHIALKKGAIFVHSSAVFFNNKGILLPGWAAVGKTVILLRFLNEDAQYISNDLTILKEDGGMLAYPIGICLNEYYREALLEVLPNNWGNMLNRREQAIRAGLTFLGTALGKTPIYAVKDMGSRISKMAKNRGLLATVPYLTLYPQGKIKMQSNLDVVFLLVSSEAAEVEISQTDSRFLASKMAPCVSAEVSSHLAGLYDKFRFAFPNKRNELIENSEKMSQEIMRKAFEGKELYYVRLPKTYDVDKLFNRLCVYL